MATIEERAKKYSLKDFDGYYTGREKALEEGYIAGATEQKVIDDAEHINQVLMGNGSINIYKQGYHDAVEKACKWLKENLPYIVCKINASEYWLGKRDFIGFFRKAMEE